MEDLDILNDEIDTQETKRNNSIKDQSNSNQLINVQESKRDISHSLQEKQNQEMKLKME